MAERAEQPTRSIAREAGGADRQQPGAWNAPDEPHRSVAAELLKCVEPLHGPGLTRTAAAAHWADEDHFVRRGGDPGAGSVAAWGVVERSD